MAACGVSLVMNDPDAIKVLIVNEEGQYLAGTATRWEFTEERMRARVFDYSQDHVAEMLRVVKSAHATVWIAIKLDPREGYEFCDHCGSRMTAVLSFFDGRQFLCSSCREKAC